MSNHRTFLGPLMERGNFFSHFPLGMGYATPLVWESHDEYLTRLARRPEYECHGF